MATRKVSINGSVLTWARREDGLTPEELADLMKVPVDDIRSWEAGEDYPTRGQFTRLGKVLARPTAMFYLPQAPTEGGIPVKFRRAPGPEEHRLGRNELRQIRQAQRLQEVASWVVEDSGAGPAPVGRADRRRDPSRVGEEERVASGVPVAGQIGWSTAYEAFRNWRRVLEDKGILVFQMRLGKDGIRGFSIWDDYAPVAAVNTAYHPAARIFTLFHEAGHLLTRTEGSCLRFIAPGDSETGAERWCEQFAASYLLPAAGLRSEAAQLGVTEASQLDDPRTARRLANRFSVSTRAMAIRLQTIGLAKAGLYGAVVSAFPKQDWPSGGGGVYPEIKPADSADQPACGCGAGGYHVLRRRITELGPLLPQLLFSAADRRRLHKHDLTDYLELTTGQVEDLRREFWLEPENVEVRR